MMSFLQNPFFFGIILFAALIVCMETGRRPEQRRLARDPSVVNSGMGAVGGVVFALSGLLVPPPSPELPRASMNAGP